MAFIPQDCAHCGRPLWVQAEPGTQEVWCGGCEGVTAFTFSDPKQGDGDLPMDADND